MRVRTRPLVHAVYGGCPILCGSLSLAWQVLDVDYGGSTGYGRAYRRRLRGNWGVVDIDDVEAGAKYCVARGLADGNKLAIDGGSAGGCATCLRGAELIPW